MSPFLRNFLVIFGALLAGSFLNMGLVMLGPSLIPPPAGADMTTMEGLKAAMPSMEPKHFIFPFLAHALGTLLAAYIASRFTIETMRDRSWIVIGAVFLVGGITNVMTLPSPMWFNILDVAGAYLPLAWLGRWLARKSDQPTVRPPA